MTGLRPRFSGACALTVVLGLFLGGCRGSGTDADLLEEGMAAFQTGRFKEAVDKLCRAADEGGQTGFVHLYLGVAYLKLNQREQARAAFEKASELSTIDATPLEFLANLHTQSGRWRDADAALRKAERRSADNPRILTALAVVELNTNNVAGAKTHLEKALELESDYAPALYDLAFLNYRWLKQEKDARQLFERYLTAAREQDQPWVAKARKAMSQMSGKSGAGGMAVSGRGEKQRPGAATEGVGAAKRRQAAADETRIGIEFYQNSNWEQARTHLRKAIELDDTYDPAPYNLGLTCTAGGDLDGAIDAFSTAIKISPGKSDPRYMLAWTLWKKKEAEKARAALDELIRRSPDYADAHFLLGLINTQEKRDVPLTRKHFRRYLELDPNGSHAGYARQWLEAHKSGAGQ